MTYDSALMRIEALLADHVGGKAFSDSEQQEIRDIFLEVCRKEVQNTSCRDCYMDALHESRARLVRQGCMTEKTAYRLKRGVNIKVIRGGLVHYYTQLTITDEIAEIFLADNPNGVNQFEELPRDWREKIEARAAAEAKKVDEVQQVEQDRVAILEKRVADLEEIVKQLTAKRNERRKHKEKQTAI